MAQTFDRNSSSISGNFRTIGTRATVAANAIAAAGTVGGTGLQRLVNLTSSVALGFGPQGAIVAAAGVTAVAITGIFQRARKEMVETDRKAREILRSLTLESGGKLSTQLRDGDAFGETEAERLGTVRARQRLEALGDAPAATYNEKTGLMVRRHDANKKEREDLIAWLGKAEPLYGRVTAQVTKLALARGAEQFLELEGSRREAAVNASRAATQQARDQEAKTLDDLRFALAEARVGLEGFNAAELVSIDLAKKAIETRREQSRTFAATLGQNAVGGYLNPTESFGNMKLPTGGLFVDWREEINAEFQNMGAQAGSTFADGISNGFQAAFSGGGIAGGFKALAGTVLSGLGGIFVQMGKSLFMYGATMKGLLPFLSNPFTSGFAAMAAGAALMALGGTLGGLMSGRGGGGRMGGGYSGGFGGSTRGSEELTKIIIMPSNASTGAARQPVQPVVFAPTIIGPNDPQAQRAVKQLYEKATGRAA